MAYRLVFKFDKEVFILDKVQPKTLALIVCDEILYNWVGNQSGQLPIIGDEIVCDKEYWQEVKSEINKI